MAFTYSGDPSASPKDALRFLVGDTDTAEQFLSDEEIAWILLETSTDPATRNIYFAAAAAAEQIAGRFAREVDFSGDQATTSLGDLQDKFISLATILRTRGREMAKQPPLPYAGGTSYTDIARHENDIDAVKPYIGTGMHDNLLDGGMDLGVPGWSGWDQLLSDQTPGATGG